MIHFLSQASLLASSKSLVSGLLFSVSALLANPEAPKKPASFDASVYVNNQGKIRLAVEKVAPTLVYVQLLDEKKHVLFSHCVARKEIKTAMLFDVSGIQDGLYTLEIKSDEGSIIRQVSLTTETQKRTINFS
ncbi:hypothetical protein [Spirosoma spitsbergense]|jgi:hypothetical protein|uniref:hypothetical protein n=1 Tax=Spirosoma spitsbergense TaxID=431554 RepID=UPI00038276EE|nr:hypothetical protein [Spirosoma spitsbergense]